MRRTILGILQTLGVVAGFVGAGLAAAALYPPAMDSERHEWLVDGFNVIQVGLLAGRERERWWGEARRTELVRRAEALDDPEARVLVVFDGPSPAPTEAGRRAHVVFAPSADDWLLARLREASHPERVRVVTADRRLAARARRRGAQVVSPAAFLARCGVRS